MPPLFAGCCEHVDSNLFLILRSLFINTCET